MMRIHLSLNSWYFLTPPSSNPWSSLKKDEINLLDLSLWWELLLAAGSCTVPIKTVFHSKVTQVSLLKTSNIPACKARSRQVTRPLFCRPLCFGRRWGGGENSCCWDELARKVRKCQDFKEVNFPRGAGCLVNAQSQKGMQDPNNLGRGPSKSSDMLLNPEQTHRQSYWNLARVDK